MDWINPISKSLAEGSTHPCANASSTVKFIVSWYISLLHKHVYSNVFTCVNTNASTSFYINRCVFARGVCSRITLKTHAKTQKNTTPTPSLTVKLLILSSLITCQITFTDAFVVVLVQVLKQMLSCQLTWRRMHRLPQKHDSEVVCFLKWLQWKHPLITWAFTSVNTNASVFLCKFTLPTTCQITFTNTFVVVKSRE